MLYTTYSPYFFPGPFAAGLDAALILVLPFVTPDGRLLGAVDGVGFFAWGFGAAVAGFLTAPATVLFVPVLGIAGFFAPTPTPVEGFGPCIAGLPADGGPVVLFVGL